MRSKVSVLGEPHRLGDRLGMVVEARRHRRRGRQHVGVVAAAQRLGGVERRVLADRDERVLQQRALRACARGRCRWRRRRHAEPPCQRGERRGCARGRGARTGAAARRAEHSGPNASSSRRSARLVADALARAAGEADEPLGVLARRRRASSRAAPTSTSAAVREGVPPSRAVRRARA